MALLSRWLLPSVIPKRRFMSAVLSELGKPLELIESKSQKVKDNEVRIKVASAGVNAGDVSMIAGNHAVIHKCPFIPGFELSGEVMEVGKAVTSFKKDDRVLALKALTTGAFAEECIAEENEVFPIPHSMTHEVAASLPVAYGTAYLTLKKLVNVDERDKLLVLTEQGSSSMALIDLAINVYKCDVYACCSSEKKLATIRPKGVMGTIDHLDQDLIAQVKKFTQNAGVDVVFDTVGGILGRQALKCIRPYGKICIAGYSSGQIPTYTAQDLIRHQASLIGVWLGGYQRRRPKNFEEMIEKIIEWYSKEYFEPYVAARFPLKDVNDALDHVSNLNALGKVILTMN